MSLDLKQYAKSYDWNGVIFYMMPYRLMETETAIAELSEAEPQTVYVNKKTNERVYDKPDALTRAEDKAAAMHMKEVKSDWETLDLWRAIHRCFVICESITVGIDFPSGEMSMEVIALRDYWQARSSNVIERWQVFKALMSTNICNVWWDAFAATRDNPAPGKTELGQAAPPTDPLEPDAGSEATTNTSDLSKAS